MYASPLFEIFKILTVSNTMRRIVWFPSLPFPHLHRILHQDVDPSLSPPNSLEGENCLLNLLVISYCNGIHDFLFLSSDVSMQPD